MDNKENLLMYNTFASSFIEDRGMSLRIQQNINFVLNYKDSVNTLFKKAVERQIAYRGLGIIVFSCIEALAKTIIDSFKKRCARCKFDNQDCDYKKFPDENDSARHSLQYLFDIRFFYLSPDDYDELIQLNDLRNYVHISKNISEKINDNKFNIDYVNRILDYYYVLVDQLDLTGDYFFGKNECLKILDDNGIKETRHMNKKDRQLFYILKLSPILIALLSNEKMSNNDKRILKMINYPNDVDFDELLKYTKMIVLHHRIRFTNDSDYFASKNSFKQRLLNYVTKEEYVDRIKNEI